MFILTPKLHYIPIFFFSLFLLLENWQKDLMFISWRHRQLYELAQKLLRQGFRKFWVNPINKQVLMNLFWITSQFSNYHYWFYQSQYILQTEPILRPKDQGNLHCNLIDLYHFWNFLLFYISTINMITSATVLVSQ